MSNIIYLDDYRDPPDYASIVARAQQDNDGIPRKVVNESLGARLLKNEKFRRDVLGDGPEAA